MFSSLLALGRDPCFLHISLTLILVEISSFSAEAPHFFLLFLTKIGDKEFLNYGEDSIYKVCVPFFFNRYRVPEIKNYCIDESNI